MSKLSPRHVVVFFLIGFFTLTLTQANLDRDIKNLMRENKVTLEEAILTLGISDAQAAESLGYDHWVTMEQEAERLSLLWADCIYPKVYTQGGVGLTPWTN